MSERERFDDSLDDATHAVMEAFEWFGLPEGDQRLTLMYQINDALTAIMNDLR